MSPADRSLRILLFGVIAAFAWLVAPFADALLIAAVVTILAWPAYSVLRRRMPKRRSLATALTVIGLTVGVLLPLTVLFVFVGRELVALVNELVAVLQGGSLSATIDGLARSRVVRWAAEYAGGTEALFAAMRSASQSMALAVAGAITQNVPGLVSVTAFAVLKVTIFYLALTTMLHRGDEFARWALRVSPLERVHTSDLFAVFAQFARNVVLAGVVSGAMQGTVAAIGYRIAGLERPLLLGALTGVLAYIPLVGTALAWVPITLLLLVQGESGAALFVVIWSIALTGTVDNFIKPILVRGRSNVPTLLVFLGVFGGLAWFGVIGLLVGPVIVAMLLALLHIYGESIRSGSTV